METENYELFFLSDLRRRANNRKYQKDFQLVVDYIFARIDGIADSNSEFNKIIVWIQKVIPKKLLFIVLHRLRYDSIVGFKTKEKQKKVYCMISFQKHPSRQMIGMFDVYITPDERNTDIARQFSTMAAMINEMYQRYKKNGFQYLQCGNNDTTRRILRLFRRICQKEYPYICIDIETSRILFH